MSCPRFLMNHWSSLLSRQWICLLLSWVVAFGLSQICHAQALLKDLIVISDVDDTIRISQILSRTDRHINTAVNYTTSQLPFEGMPELYQELARNGARMEYVSSLPKPIGFFGRNFLKNSSFPDGKLWTRTDSNRASHKIKTIRRILSDNPGKKVILLGDNGESDPEVYEKIMKDPELGHQVQGVFIREIYDRGPLPAHETAFLTSADLSARFSQLGLVEDSFSLRRIDTTNQILSIDPEQIPKKLEAHAHRTKAHQVSPRFSEVSEERISEILSPLADQASPLNAPLLELKEHLVRRAEKRTILGCFENFLLRVFKSR